MSNKNKKILLSIAAIVAFLTALYEFEFFKSKEMNCDSEQVHNIIMNIAKDQGLNVTSLGSFHEEKSTPTQTECSAAYTVGNDTASKVVHYKVFYSTEVNGEEEQLTVETTE